MNLRALLPLFAILAPAAALATGAYDEGPPPTLPYFLDRLPAKPPSEIFRETFPGGPATFKSADLKAALLTLAADCEAARKPPAALLAATDELLARARLDPQQAAVFCNLLNDVRDLFAAAPPAIGKPAAGYIRWRVQHADWFRISWTGEQVPEQSEEQQTAARVELANHASDPAAGPLAVHWIYLSGAHEYPGGGEDEFAEVVAKYPDHPRAEAARFMLARGKLRAARISNDGDHDPTPDELAVGAKTREEARASFEDYLKRYPKGRFIADVPGWLGALAFDEKDYLKALDCYLRQADMPGHPEVLKSAGFMCERCLSNLADTGDQAALQRVAAHPRLAMSLIYLLVNADSAPGSDDGPEPPTAKVSHWRRALLPRLAAEVAAQKAAYADAGWQPRYLAILAQAASGAGDQEKALQLCDGGKAEFERNDDLAFIRLVALERARKLPEAIAAGRDFARNFPRSALAPGATLRLALALQDAHQAGAAVGELSRLERALTAQNQAETKRGEWVQDTDDTVETLYPPGDAELGINRSILRRNASGADSAQVAQLIDTLLNFSPLPDLASAFASGSGVALEGADQVKLRAVLAQRWLAEEENFTEARKYVTPAQWSVAAASLAKLTADAAAAPKGEAQAAAYLKLADAWTEARGKVVFAPLETDASRELFANERENAGQSRRENALALGLPAEAVNHSLTSRDEWRHAFAWRLKAADASDAKSPLHAKALWGALRTMPSMALASPYLFLHAGEADESALSHKLYDRLRTECPDSREAREFAVYYDLAPPKTEVKAEEPAADGTPAPAPKAPEPNLNAASSGEVLQTEEPEYRWDEGEDSADRESDADSEKTFSDVLARAIALRDPDLARHPAKMLQQVEAMRGELRAVKLARNELFLVNYLDDLNDFLREAPAKLTAAVVTRYLGLRIDCLSVAHWGFEPGDGGLPDVIGSTPDTLNATVLDHIRAAYRSPEMSPFKDYLDYLALAVIANSKFEVEVPGAMEAKDRELADRKSAVTYPSRDYPKLVRLAEGFLKDHPHSRKREAVSFLYARWLYASSRPRLRLRFTTWPESGTFASGQMAATNRQAPFDPRKIGAALNAYGKEFPKGRYAGEVRNLRGLLAWRTQDWPLAVDLTLQTLEDESDAVLSGDASRRLTCIFVDGLNDETERVRCLAAIKAHPPAVEKLREHLSQNLFPLLTMRSWLLAQL